MSSLRPTSGKGSAVTKNHDSSARAGTGIGHGHETGGTSFGISLCFSWLERVSVVFTILKLDLNRTLNEYICCGINK